MLALVGTVMLRSASGELLLSEGDRVLGTHRVRNSRGLIPLSRLNAVLNANGQRQATNRPG